MKVLILADIHGNLNALEAVLEASKIYKWKELWCLGDLGGYGPEPEKCFNLLRSEKAVIVPGNHDLYLAGRMKGSFFSLEAHKSLIYSRSCLSRETVNILKILPEKQKRRGITLVHGSPRNPSSEYILNKEDAIKNFSSFNGFCCLFGHTHIQEYYRLTVSGLEQGSAVEGESVKYKQSRILINPGSVGQPRDGNNKAAWAIIDTGKKEVIFNRTEYDIKGTQEKMRAADSSEYLINRLEKGI